MHPAEPDLDQIIAQMIGDAAEMLTVTRLERARRKAASEDTSIIDQVLPHLEQLAAVTHNVEIFQRIQAVVDRSTGRIPTRRIPRRSRRLSAHRR